MIIGEIISIEAIMSPKYYRIYILIPAHMKAHISSSIEKASSYPLDDSREEYLFYQYLQEYLLQKKNIFPQTLSIEMHT